MAIPAPSAAPPSFYDNLPQGGSPDGAGAGAPPQKPDQDTEDDIMLGFGGVIRVLNKMKDLKAELKPGIDKIKDQIKELTVQVLKRNPADLEKGDKGKPAEGKPAGTEPPAAESPKTTDETHAA